MSFNGSERTGDGGVLLVVGALLALLGLAVMVGWHGHVVALVQLHPALVPMQYNTALSFLLAGSGLIAIARGARGVANIAAVGVFVITAATLSQYVFGVDLGIDQLIMRHDIVVHTSHPGRMAPSTALLFVLGAVAQLLAVQALRVRYAYEAATYIAAVMVAVAAATLVGYAVELQPLVGWGRATYMALHTAVGHLVFGLAIGAWAIEQRNRRGADRLHLGGALSFGSIFALTLILWSGLERQIDEGLQASLRADARWFATRADSEFADRTRALDRMARRWEAFGGYERRLWEQDAQGYVRDLAGFQAVEWADAGGRVRWVVPRDGNENAVGLDLTAEPVRAAMLTAARRERRAVASGSIQLQQGGEGFLIAHPLFVGDRFDGYVIGVFRIESMMNGLMGPNALFGEGYLIERGGRVVYRGASGEADITGQYMTEPVPLALGDGGWSVRLASMLAERGPARSLLPYVVLASGLVVAFFVAVIFGLWGVTSRRAGSIARANAALASSESRLEMATEIARIGHFRSDLRTGAIEWSDRLFGMLGFRPGEVAPSVELLASTVVPEEREAVMASIGRAYAHTYAVRSGERVVLPALEYRARLRDGTECWLRSEAQAEIDDAGRPAVVHGTVQDITERKRAEIQMRETTQLLDLVVENIPAMVFMKRANDLRFVLFNKAGEALTGFARNDLLGKNDYDFFPKEQADFFTQKDREVLAQGFADIPEESIDTRSGGRRLLHTRKIALHDEQGRPRYLLGISEDITESKRAEVALRDSAGRIRAIVDNVVDGIITIDEQGRIESFNVSAEKIFGYRADEMIGQNVNMLMPEPYHSKHDRYVANYVHGGPRRIIGIGREVEGLRKDGSVFPLDLAVSEFQVGGRRLFTGIVRDITERRKVERLKGEFISTVSHELRTPLTSIRGALGLLASGALGEFAQQAKSLIDIAHKNSERLSRLINDILDIEKIASGKMKFDMRPHSVMGLVEQALVSNQSYAVQHGVRFSLVRRVDSGEIRVDAERFQQVMANLLSNAAKFSPAGAAVDVTVERMAADMRVSVRDRGSGIPADFRTRVFEKFTQADGSDARAKGGSGLGLAITRDLVERMGGRIGFETEEGAGTTFHIQFAEHTAAALPQRMPLARPGTRLLVVEDDPDVARLLDMLLQGAGYVTDVVHSAEEAHARLVRQRYDAMTLDLVLPGQDGISLIRQLRGQPKTRDLPVVVVSAKVEEGRLAINGEFSAIDWLGKPIDERALVVAVQAVVSRVYGYRPRVLHVEDDTDLHRVIVSMAAGAADFDHASTLREARDMLALERYSLIVLDLALPDGSGWELLPMLRELDPSPPVVVLSGRDVTDDEARQVSAAFVKSRVSSEELLAVLQRVVPGTDASATPDKEA